MARRATAPAPTDSPEVSTEAEVPTSPTEEIVTTATEPIVDEVIDPAATPEAPAENSDEPDEVVDTSALDSALDALLSGEIPSDLTTIDFTSVVEAYNTLTRKGKAKATRDMGTKSTDLLESEDFVKARVVLLANKATKAAKPKAESKPRTPADVTGPVVEKLAAFQLAYGALSTNLPEGISEDWSDQVSAAYNAQQAEIAAFVAWQNNTAEDKGDAPALSPSAEMAVKLAFKSTRKPYGPRHDVGTHIEQVFAALPSGSFLSNTEIAAASSEEYGDSKATISAVNARTEAVAKQNKPLAEGLSVTEVDGVAGVVKA